MGVRLPSEYQEVEYIQSDRNEYLNLGIRYDSSMEIETVFTGLYSGGGARGNFFGAKDDNAVMYIDSNNYANANYVAYRGNVSDIVQTRASGYNNNDPYRQKFIITSQAVEIYKSMDDGATWRRMATNNTPAPEFSVENPLFLFWCNSPNESLRKWRGKCFGLDIKNVMQLIPCYRKSDSEPGMYDLVSGSFLTNAGSGEFIVGPDVIDSISPWLVARRMGMVSQLARINNPPDGAIFWNGVNCEDVQNGFSYYYRTGGGESSDIRITVENGALVIYKPTSANFDCQPRDSIDLTGKHTVSVVCKTSRPLNTGNDQLLFGITSGPKRTDRVVDKDITSDVTTEYKTFSVNFQSDSSGWPHIRATGSAGKDPYSVIVKEWVIS